MDLICPNSPKCPIFNGILAGKEYTASVYRKKYCEGGEAAFKTCKRYMANEKFGSCPPNLLPNSSLSLGEIGVRYSLL